MSLRWRAIWIGATVMLFGYYAVANFASQESRLESPWVPYSSLRLGLDRIGGIFNKTGEMSDEARDLIAHNMVDTSRKTDLSPTFRKGEIGNWKDHFKQSHVDAFKEADLNNWLERLGYVDDHDW